MAKKTPNQELNDASYNYHLTIYKEVGDSMCWIMKDGTDIMIKDMSDSHIKNTITMLKRKAINGTRIAWIEILEDQYLNRRSSKIKKIKDNIDLNNILGCEDDL